MKLWVDDVRPAPNGYVWCKSVDDAKKQIELSEKAVIKAEELAQRQFSLHNFSGRNACYRMAKRHEIELIDIDHDAGNYAKYGGDYIKLLDWLEETNRNYPIRIHSMNPVGVANMRVIIERNGWTEVK